MHHFIQACHASRYHFDSTLPLPGILNPPQKSDRPSKPSEPTSLSGSPLSAPPFASKSALASVSRSTTWRWPASDAKCKGVRPQRCRRVRRKLQSARSMLCRWRESPTKTMKLKHSRVLFARYGKLGPFQGKGLHCGRDFWTHKAATICFMQLVRLFKVDVWLCWLVFCGCQSMSTTFFL